MTTREKINYSLAMGRMGSVIKITFNNPDIDTDLKVLTKEYHAAGWTMSIEISGNQTTLVFNRHGLKPSPQPVV